MNILFIQVDFNRMTSSLPWTYHCHVGVAEALQAIGHKVDFVLTSQPQQLLLYSADVDYDLCIVNDVIHGFASQDPNCNTIPLAVLQFLRRRGIPILGILIESVFHRKDESIHDTLHDHRRQVVEQSAMWMDFVVSYDKFDAEYLRDIGIHALWTPFFSRRPLSLSTVPLTEQLVFYGTMYPKRVQFLQSSGLDGRISGGYVSYPPQFGEFFERMQTLVKRPDADVEVTQRLASGFKSSVFLLYAQHLIAQSVIINLPSIFKGIACRVVEALTIGRPTISPIPRHEEERRLLNQYSELCVTYDEQQPDGFARKLAESLERSSRTEVDDSMQQQLERSPFNPNRFAHNLTDFLCGSRTAKIIEASYLD